MIIISGVVADSLRKNWLSTTMVRKLMSIAGFGMTALSLLGLAYVGCDKVLAIVLLVGATGGEQHVAVIIFCRSTKR